MANWARYGGGRRRLLTTMLLSACWMLWLPKAEAWGYTPESPEVQAMLKKAVDFMARPREGRSYTDEWGGLALLGLATFKTNHDASHPAVVAGVERTRAVVSNRSTLVQEDNYSLGLAIIFMCELDADRYADEISTMLVELQRRQRPDGAWSYPEHPTGDTSQTQYGVLATWSAYRAGIRPTSWDWKTSMEQVTNWLLRTQDPTGAWGYQGVDNGSFTREQQERITPSVVVAGLGSLYIASDLLGLVGRPEQPEQDPNLPSALKRVLEPSERPVVSTAVDRGILRRALADGDRWIERNYSITTSHWQFYYMYGLERYMSFRELAVGDTQAEPGWYNDGVEYLKQAQKADGSWQEGRYNSSPEIDTAFAALFLLRSSKKSIERVALAGVLRGGRGLPKDVRNVRMDGNRVVGPPIGGSVNDLLEMLESQDDVPVAQLDQLAEQLLSQEGSEEEESLLQKRLREFATVESYQARRVAVRALARSGDIDSAPVLIFALSDPDARIRREARDGLRMLSRKVDGFGMPDDPTPEQIQTAQERWKQWYQSIRPAADLDLVEFNNPQ